MERDTSALNLQDDELSLISIFSCLFVNHCKNVTGKNVTGKNVTVKILLVKKLRLTIQLFGHLLN